MNALASAVNRAIDPDWSDCTEDFLDHFEGKDIFVSMPEHEGSPIHWHDEWANVKERVAERSGFGWGSFWTVNELDQELDPEKNRTGKMWTRSRAVFMDDDTRRKEPRDDFPLEPSLVVKTSGDEEKGYKFHYYWITSTQDKEVWEGVQNRIIDNYDGDRNARDLSRYLRLPGFNHNKRWVEGDKEGNIERCPMVVFKSFGLKYEWSEIVENFPPMKDSAEGGSGNDSRVMQSAGGKSIDQSKAEIANGENYHENLLSLSYQMKQERVPDPYIVMVCEGLMNKVPDDRRDARWQDRYNEIERTVKGAEEKKDEPVDLSNVVIHDHNEKVGEIPWPPGLFGHLCEDAYNMQRYQYREIAVISGIGLVAGMCGRKFNVSGTGLNVYLTLVMRTGLGKDSIDEFISTSLSKINDAMNGEDPMSFLGNDDFTGGKAVINALMYSRSQVSVITEAGLMLKGTSGDKENLRKMLLSLYGRSGKKRWSGKKGFSSEDNSIPRLRAPALTIVSEAPPDLLLTILKKDGSLEGGDLPRQSIYRIEKPRPPMNFSAVCSQISDACLQRIKELANLCSKVQAESDPQAIDLDPDSVIAEDFRVVEGYYTDLYNEMELAGKRTHAAMATRCYVKILRFAAIATVFNYGSKNTVIHKEEWEWAKRMVQFEMDGISHFFQGSLVGNPLEDASKREAGPAILRILRGEYSRNWQCDNKELAAAGIFPAYVIRQILMDRSAVQALGDVVEYKSKPVGGEKKVLNHMVESGYLIPLKKKTRVGGAVVSRDSYQVTGEFKVFMEEVPDF